VDQVYVAKFVVVLGKDQVVEIVINPLQKREWGLGELARVVVGEFPDLRRLA
jgi:hypothetical protein